MLGQEPTRHRPKRRRGGIGARQISLVLAALARRHRLGDQRLRQRHQPTATEPLQQPRTRQHQDTARGGTERRGSHEHADRHEHHAPAPERIAKPAIDRRGDRVGHQIRHNDPGDPLHLAQGSGNVRQRGRHNGLVQRRQEHRQHDRRKVGQELGAGANRQLGLVPVGPEPACLRAAGRHQSVSPGRAPPASITERWYNTGRRQECPLAGVPEYAANGRWDRTKTSYDGRGTALMAGKGFDVGAAAASPTRRASCAGAKPAFTTRPCGRSSSLRVCWPPISAA